MNHLDLTLPSPEANLACDEALLDACEQGETTSVLRLWEAPRYFVALGHSNRTHQEINPEFCRQHSIPVLRRCSGGGTVLQGPGCLSYSLILDVSFNPDLENVTKTNGFVMDRHRKLFTDLAGKPVQVRGHTDLCLGGLKFSGNAQRRKRSHVLFHGTILLDFDLDLIEHCLRLPPRQPAYREHRSHVDFLTCLNLPRERIAAALRDTWNASEPLTSVPHDRINALARDKYSSDAWNQKFS